VVSSDREVAVEIPAGVDNGTRLRLNREGETAPRNGKAGDLFVEIVVRLDERFERSGADLAHRVSVGLAEAALGTTVEVPLLGGQTHALDVPPGTQPGWRTAIRGEGMSRLGRRGRGDLIVAVDVAVPTDLSKEESDLLRQFADLRGEKPTIKRRWL